MKGLAATRCHAVSFVMSYDGYQQLLTPPLTAEEQLQHAIPVVVLTAMMDPVGRPAECEMAS